MKTHLEAFQYKSHYKNSWLKYPVKGHRQRLKTEDMGCRCILYTSVVYLCFIKLPPPLRISTARATAAREARPLNLHTGKYKVNVRFMLAFQIVESYLSS